MIRYSFFAAGALIVPVSVLWTACGDDSSTCPPDQICDSGSTGTSSGPGTGSGGNGGNGTGGGGGGDVCQITCTPWQTDGVSDDATRTCTSCPGQSPATTATLPALDIGYFKCDVQPILNRACSQQACHGNDNGRALRLYGRGRYRLSGEMGTQTGCPPGTTEIIDFGNCVGSIECGCFSLPKSTNEWRRNFDASRGFLLDFITAEPIANVTDSELLTQPTEGSGKAHANFKFFNLDDAEYKIVQNWLNGMADPACVTND